MNGGLKRVPCNSCSGFSKLDHLIIDITLMYSQAIEMNKLN